MRPNLARPMLALCLLGLLAACGADGEPTAPATTAPGLTLSGGVKMGVGYSE